MRALIATVALAGCGPVLLGEEVGESFDDAAASDAARVPDAGSMTAAMRPADAAVQAAQFNVLITISPPDCDGCYQLQASALGGKPPFTFEWKGTDADDETGPEKTVCWQTFGTRVVAAVAIDATGAKSQASAVQLNPREEPCPPPPRLACLENPSFDGRAAVNLGLPATFDIANWRTCTNPQATNTPDVASESLTMNVPEAWLMPVKATEGLTYIAMQQDEQVSQTLCEGVPGGAELHLNLDVMRVNLPTGTAPTGTVGLEIWGGIAADCSRRELLWATSPIEVGEIGWHTHCATLRPIEYMDSLFFRTIVDRAQTNATYLLLDNLVPLDSCS